MNWNNPSVIGATVVKRAEADFTGLTTKKAHKRSFFGSIYARLVRKPVLIFLAMVALSLPIHFVKLEAPFSGEHEFRQTQTALSVWDIREHGVSLLHPRLPLFGPPWECPFEYPVFQMIAASVDYIAPWSNLDVSIRVTNLLFFYLTAAALAILTNLLLCDHRTALFASGAFLFSPYNAFWSRTSMIEYAATFFGLVYLIGFVYWFIRPVRWVFILTLVFGVVASLTKTTSFAIPLVTAGAIASLSVFEVLRKLTTTQFFGRNGFASRQAAEAEIDLIRTEFRVGVALSALLIFPVLVGYAYTWYGDHIKQQLPYTALLSLSQPDMKHWTYGTFAQRLSGHNWARILTRVASMDVPALGFAMLIGLLALPCCVRRFTRMSEWNRLIGISMALAPVIGISIFFNLYVIHSYYLIACAPFLALFGGVGLTVVFKLAKTRFLQLLFMLLLVGLMLHEWSAPLGAMWSSVIGPNQNVVYLSEAARQIQKEEPVIILSSSGWSAFAPYYLKRRAFMLMPFRKPDILQPLLDEQYFKKNGFHWLLTEGNANGISELTALMTNQWKFARVVFTQSPYVLYSLSDKRSTVAQELSR